ncbi:MAG: bifunctional 2-keto-4-hydroxyglutarate aldolase/2-keto-3-deoxy-6-phosphogluconate aldolase [Candidatus Ancillula sp.]|nr:bifunctional 2-keto-4-hydroxyglutarate aldolase/2-keto-3-deoxy-6-phosphogluconate aldolase [Candidatus Ancillula sp.]
MKKVDILKRLEAAGVIAVVRGSNRADVLGVVDALIDGGVVGIELTFTVPHADEIIETISEKYADDSRVILGAGTVLEPITARIAILAGAQYIVSPHFDAEIAQICNLYQIPYLPGCETIREVTLALKSGADIIKLFPGSAFGPSYVKALKAPLPHANIMPTGGVSLENMADWFAAGVVTVGAGGNLTTLGPDKDFEAISETASKWIAKLNEIRGGAN